MKSIITQFIDLDNYITEHNIKPNADRLLCEGVTYYDLRRFLTLISRNNKDSHVKDMLKSIIKTLSTLEVKNKPVPLIPRLKAVSPEIFPHDDDEDK